MKIEKIKNKWIKIDENWSEYKRIWFKINRKEKRLCFLKATLIINYEA